MDHQEILDPHWFEQRLHTDLIGAQIRVLDEVDSTNAEIKRQAQQDAVDGLALLAHSQTQGKGRFGRVWHSEKNTGIYLSILLKPPIPLARIHQLTLVTGVSVVKAVNTLSTLPARLKWPNDLLLNGKKVCGILAETLQIGDACWVVLGIGVNVSQTRFPHELQDLATSLHLENRAPVDRGQLILSILEHLDRDYRAYLQTGLPPILKQWAEHTDLFGKRIRLTHTGKTVAGTALSLDDHGRLRVRTDQGVEELFDSGEVTLLKD